MGLLNRYEKIRMDKDAILKAEQESFGRQKKNEQNNKSIGGR